MPDWNPAFANIHRELERRATGSAGTPPSGTGTASAGADTADAEEVQGEEEVWRNFTAAIDRAIPERSGQLLEAIRLYRAHPSRRCSETAPVAWRAGSTALRDYGLRAPDGPPVLVVPSLVNRFHILDLGPERSLLRDLEGRGFRPFVVDWDRPGTLEAGFSLTDYVTGPLEGCLDAVRAITGRPPLVLGYCMGGLLALALATRRQHDMRGLGLLATPWDFAADPPPVTAFLPLLRPWLEAASAGGRAIGADAIQALFHTLDPMQVIRKFLRFRELDKARAEDFVILEDWLNDGVPLAGPVAAEVLSGWYGDNLPGRCLWKIAGRTIDPAMVKLPALVMIPSRDRIVPPASAGALGRRLPHAGILHVPFGHVGMMASMSAGKAVREPLASWMKEIT